MKSLLKMTLIAGTMAILLAGCDEKQKDIKNDQPVMQEKVNIDVNSESYALGAYLATDLKSNFEQNNIDLNTDEIINGFNQALHDQSKYSKDQIKEIMTALNKEIVTKITEKKEAEETARVSEGKKFIEEFEKQDGVKKTESGLLYQIVQPGDKNHPKANDSVTVNYTGSFVNGTKFDSSYDRNQPAQFHLTDVIKGWTEGLPLIGVGGKLKLVIPPELAFGDKDISGIPAKSTLVFDIELVSIDSYNDNSAKK